VPCRSITHDEYDYNSLFNIFLSYVLAKKPHQVYNFTPHYLFQLLMYGVTSIDRVGVMERPR
jgi:hypothetical protein